MRATYGARAAAVHDAKTADEIERELTSCLRVRIRMLDQLRDCGCGSQNVVQNRVCVSINRPRGLEQWGVTRTVVVAIAREDGAPRLPSSLLFSE